MDEVFTLSFFWLMHLPLHTSSKHNGLFDCFTSVNKKTTFCSFLRNSSQSRKNVQEVLHFYQLCLSRWNEDKLKMYEFKNIFPTFTGIPQKSYKRSFLFTLEKLSKRPSRFELVCRGKCINWKKLNVKTLSIPYTKRWHQSCYLKNELTGHKGVTNAKRKTPI